jgi:hypothetical protein
MSGKMIPYERRMYELKAGDLLGIAKDTTMNNGINVGR